MMQHAGKYLPLLLLWPTVGCVGNMQGDAYVTTVTTPTPGTVTLHRLNRAEYNNTVRDLLNTAQTPGDGLPAESVTFGFDNIADALTVSDASVRIYQQAAESLAAEATNPNNPEYARLVTCDPNTLGQDACATQVATNFAYYAWRHRVTSADVSGILTAAKANASDFHGVVTNIVTYTLLAPDFLFRIELDPSNNPNTPHALSDYELAARLSYFLWSSMPDDALFAAADSNTLHQDDVLRTQTERMLADPKALAFITNFTGQWLQLRGLSAADPSPTVYPNWDETLRASMQIESYRFIKDFLTNDAPMTEMFTAKYTYINDRLAQHYGYLAPKSSAVVRFDLPAGSTRGGILTQGAWLTTLSHQDRSGVVARGKSVMGQLLCSPPPAPPPNVPPLSNASGFQGTQRQHLDAHVSQAACAACHNIMDPIGFAFEGFDGIGAARTQDNNFPVDTTGQYKGTPFVDAQSLTQLVLNDSHFVPCTVSTLFTYAVGRGPTASDTPLLNGIEQSWLKQGESLPQLIHLIVQSDAFRMRGGN